jgi:hypothetical protein
MNKKLSLSLAIASSLGLFAQQATAAGPLTGISIDFHPGQTQETATFAAELPANQATLDLTSAVDTTKRQFLVRIPVPTYEVSTTNPFFVKLSLIGGSTFDNFSASKMYCATAAGGVGATYTATPTVGGDGFASLTYELKPAPLAATPIPEISLNADAVSTHAKVDGKGCLFNFSALSDMADNMVNQSLSAVVEYKDGNSTVTKSYSAPLIKFTQAGVVKYDPAKNVAIVDVSKGSQRFTTAASIGGASTLGESTAFLGTVTYTAAINPAPYAANGANFAIKDAIGEVTLTVKGLPLGAVAEPTVSGDSNNGWVYLTKKGSKCNTGAAGADRVDVAKQVGSLGTVSFTMTSVTAVAGVAVCMVVDGAHTITEGQITAELSAAAASSYRPVLSKENNNLVNVTKNGDSVKVLNIPSPNGVDKAFIRINNMGNQSGKVYGTLYNQADGSVLGVANTELGSLAPYETIVINDAAFISIFGIDTWTGRAWMQIDAELSDIAVQGLVRTPAGVLSNLSEGGKAKTTTD